MNKVRIHNNGICQMKLVSPYVNKVQTNDFEQEESCLFLYLIMCFCVPIIKGEVRIKLHKFSVIFHHDLQSKQ